MPNLREQVRNEGFCLLALCRDLTAFISSGRTRRTYLVETEEFLEYISTSLKSLDGTVRQAIEDDLDDELLRSKLREFNFFRKALSWLYVLTKEAIDADTLSIPYPLTVLLNDIARRLEGDNKVRLAVLGASDLMYYKYNLKKLRELTQHLESVIEGFPVLPEHIGILKFPYCGAHNVLVNCILFHEMGHYIYEETRLEDRFIEKIEKELAAFVTAEHVFEELKPDDPVAAWNVLLLYVRGLMTSWTDEIFADVLATRILGPAFHFACLQMEHVLPTDIKNDMSFSRTHPADNFRFKIHAKWLKDGEWDEIIAERTPEVFERLNDCEKLELKDFTIRGQPPLGGKTELEARLHKWMLEKLEEILPQIEEKASDKLAKIERPINDFMINNELVTKYLEHGVVPSTVYDEQKNRHYPKPTTILNSGFFFYLDGMKKLIEKVQAGVSQVEKRLKYEKRLNEWLAKAIEDWQVLQMGP